MNNNQVHQEEAPWRLTGREVAAVIFVKDQQKQNTSEIHTCIQANLQRVFWGTEAVETGLFKIVVLAQGYGFEDRDMCDSSTEDDHWLATAWQKGLATELMCVMSRRQAGEQQVISESMFNA